MPIRRTPMNKPITRLVKWIKRKKRRAVFYKVMLVCVELYAMVMLGMSYYLAYIGRDVVLEELSKTLVKTIVYPFVAFTINRTVENFAEHNISSFHKPLSEEPKGEEE